MTLLAGILLLTTVVRWQMLDFHLERDEGEYAYMGQGLLDGIVPYAEHGTQKFPGVYYVAAASMFFFGETARGLHMGLLLVSLVTTVFSFLLGRRLWNDVAGVVAAGVVAVHGMSTSVLGSAAHMTHFVIVFVVAGFFLLVRAHQHDSSPSLVAAGLSLGTAVVMRQTSLAFVAMALAAWILLRWRSDPPSRVVIRGIVLMTASLVPLVVLLVHLASAGVFQGFLTSTITYAFAYTSQVPASSAVGMFTKNLVAVATPNLVFWIAAIPGAIHLARTRGDAAVVVSSLLLAGFVVILPGFYFRSHYFVQLLPAVGLLAGAGSGALWARLPSPVTKLGVGVVGILAITSPVVQQSDFWLSSPDEATRSLYGANPFPESPVVGGYLKANTLPGDTIGVLGSEPQILFHADRKSATRALFVYPMMEKHALARPFQDDMMREFEERCPKFIVMVDVQTSWLVQPDSDVSLLQWSNRFLRQNYTLDGVADILADGTTYVWGPSAVDYRAESGSVIEVFRRTGERCSSSATR